MQLNCSRSYAAMSEFGQVWLVGSGVTVLNEPSESFTFDGLMGASEIDVKVANAAARTAFDFS